MKMPVTEALAIAVIGFCTVILILAIIAVLIIILSKTIRATEKIISAIKKIIAKKASASSATPTAPSPAQAAPEGINGGEVELIGTDEKTAAVIMAIVSQQSGIPLNRLSFKSIRLVDDNKKGDGAK